MATVLIVDDEPAIVELLAEVVIDAGFTPLKASDGLQALDLARVHRPVLIITDVMMPHMDGYTLLDTLRTDRELAGTTVILMSASFPQYPRPQNATVYLHKPFDLALVEHMLSSFSSLPQ